MAAKLKDKKSNRKNKGETIGSEDIRENADIDSGGSNKKNKKNKKDKKAKKKKKGIRRIIPLLLLLLVTGALVATIGFNVFGIRERYARGFLEKIPIVKNILPPALEGEEEENEFADMTRNELIARIEQLNNRIQTAQAEIDTLQEKNNKNNEELLGFYDIEEQLEQFRRDKEEFDRMIAENDPSAYSKFYESIDPANAAILYQEAVAANQLSKELRDYVATFGNMGEAEAARVLEEMISTDMNLIVLILSNIDSTTRGAILSAMNPTNAASVAKQMAPMGEQ